MSNKLDLPVKGKELTIKEANFYLQDEALFHSGYSRDFDGVNVNAKVDENTYAINLVFEEELKIFGIQYTHLQFERDFYGYYRWYARRNGTWPNDQLTPAANKAIKQQYHKWAIAKVDELHAELRAKYMREKAKRLFESAAKLEDHAKKIRKRAHSFMNGQINELP